MLLSMQNVVDSENNIIQSGLVPSELKGTQSETKQDGV